ncbi:MAG: DotI/IcmL/TraM family protein [Rhodospirillales bacterium]|nr:DotI/IcmL/TraM family protein [Rhodospirillales bacterium]MCB9965204.1 DotI/IcmL/TraM family protein [Rhodospirillales bacterium]MCB9973223.1 DotI/IcmL/TraM family protein [Rhodospirillales bacterium]MCB9979516.1 DotI/IcmL/TraM family protein [Rhodospirillales bacterium]
MKFDTVIIGLVVLTVGFLFVMAKDYEKKGSFVETIEITLGLKQRENGPKPEETLVAPFADSDIKPYSLDERQHAALPVDKIPLDQPHQSVQNINEWLVQNVGNALILDKTKIGHLGQDIAPVFTEAALEQYKNFGKTTNIFSAVFHGEDTTLETYLPQNPSLYRAGPVDGIYQWTFEISAVLNLVKGKLIQYKNATAKQQQKDVTFCITVQRTAHPDIPNGLLISNWQTGRCK